MTVFARALSTSSAPTLAGDGRTVVVQLVRWGEFHKVSDDGRTFYEEAFAPNGLRSRPGPVYVRDEHDPAELAKSGATLAASGAAPGREGVLVGRLVSTQRRSDGLYGEIRMASNDDAQRVLGLLPEVLDTLSIEFDDVYRPVRAGDRITRSDAVLTGLVFTPNPQRGDARVLAVRSHHQENMHMDNADPTTPTTAPPAEQAPAEPTSATRSEHGPITINVGAAPPAPTAVVASTRSAPAPGGPAGGGLLLGEGAADLRFLHGFRSFGEFCHAAAVASQRNDHEQHVRALHVGLDAARNVASFRRAFATATTADIAGLLPPQWLTEVIDLMRVLTPTVNAFDSGALPSEGMTITQPIVTQRPLVNRQAAQLDEPASRKVTIGSVSWTVDTYAGGDRMSLQSLVRSTPSYLDQVMRLFVMEMARDWNGDVAAGVLAAADDVNTTALEWTTGNAFPDLVIDAGAIFLQTLGRPAEVVGLSVGAWVALGKAKDSTGRYLFPDINPTDTVGTFDLQSATGQIRKVSYFVEPAFGDEDVIGGVIGVREAYRSLTSPMGTLTADVPTALGRDVAVYQFGAHGKVDAAGLVLFENDTP